MSERFTSGISPAFRAYYGAIVIAGVILAYLLFPSVRPASWAAVAWWVVFIIVADLSPISLPGASADITVSSTLDYAAIALFGPAPAAMIEVISTFVTQFIFARRPAYKVLFNVCLFVITISAAGAVFVLLGGREARSIGDLLLPLGACGLVYYTVNTGGVSIIVGLSERLSPWRVWQRTYVWTLIHLACFVPLGALIVVVYRVVGIPGVVLFLLPLLLARYTFKMYTDMREVHIETVRALTSAIDASDPFTRGHSDRVLEYATAIARRMGLPERLVETIQYASLLHDIGKIAIQHDVLLKPGALDDKEWETMKSHPQTGARIVEDLRFLKGAYEVVLHHHERYDGSGYPDGLAGEQIPLEARIVNVADAFDAMLSNRPYRRALSLASAISELRKGSGSQFDPDVARVFVELVESGEVSVGQRDRGTLGVSS
ncbi:MAG: HD-GYP domain-containing protein [Armatimonadetes bacterium]|nr:HD-GYP domain-containing protein [Armatimonadota bacterium]